MTFTKLFCSITESTIWDEPDHVRICWITLLAKADRLGRIWATIPGLANLARLTIEQVEDSIKRFQEPDKYSRTPDNEGRRIEQIDGGWRLLNHGKYREIRDQEAIKESKRRYINNVRSLERQDQSLCPGNEADDVENVDRCRHNAEGNAEADSESDSAPAASPAPAPAPTPSPGPAPESEPSESQASDDDFEIFWREYPRKKGKGDAESAWRKIANRRALLPTIIAAIKRQKKSDQWRKKEGNFIPYPATWLNRKSWLDEEGISLSVGSDIKKSPPKDIECQPLLDEIQTLLREPGKNILRLKELAGLLPHEGWARLRKPDEWNDLNAIVKGRYVATG